LLIVADVCAGHKHFRRNQQINKSINQQIASRSIRFLLQIV